MIVFIGCQCVTPSSPRPLSEDAPCRVEHTLYDQKDHSRSNGVFSSAPGAKTNGRQLIFQIIDIQNLMYLALHIYSFAEYL